MGKRSSVLIEQQKVWFDLGREWQPSRHSPGQRFRQQIPLCDEESDSDTESVLGVHRSTRRRLTLVEGSQRARDPIVEIPQPAAEREVDSHEDRFNRVRHAMQHQRDEEDTDDSDIGGVAGSVSRGHRGQCLIF